MWISLFFDGTLALLFIHIFVVGEAASRRVATGGCFAGRYLEKMRCVLTG